MKRVLLAALILSAAANIYGAAIVDGIAGFAAQNGGTTGGAGGPEVTVSTLADFSSYATDNNPRIIKVSGEINSGDDKGASVRVGNNKTILGCGSGAFFNGVGLLISSKTNIIIRNIKFSMVAITTRIDEAGVYSSTGDEGRPQILTNGGDCIGIQGTSANIWIDHCEFYAEDPHVQTNQDLYDGLIDAKNGSQYITISWCYFHDHHKCHLIGSSDTDNYDRKITFHHNYYRNIKERMPSYRFGTGHVYNNYYLDVLSMAVNSRMGACLRVERNYFEDSSDPVITKNSTSDGNWDLSDSVSGAVNSNIYLNCTGSMPAASTCAFDPPYIYAAYLDAAADVKANVLANAGVGKITINCGGATETPTPYQSPTRTRTQTFTRTQTATKTATLSATQTGTSQLTNTFTATKTLTLTGTCTATRTATLTPSVTHSATPVSSVTSSRTPYETFTETPGMTNTAVLTVTFTRTKTSTALPSETQTFTPTPENTATATPADTGAFTATATATAVSTATKTNTSTKTSTQTATAACTRTLTVLPSATATKTSTPAPTATAEWGNKFEITDALLYPNPARRYLDDIKVKIDITRPAMETKIRIFTVNFRLIYEKPYGAVSARRAVLTIPAADFKDFAAGVYYLVVTGRDDKGSATSKPRVLIIIQ